MGLATRLGVVGLLVLVEGGCGRSGTTGPADGPAAGGGETRVMETSSATGSLAMTMQVTSSAFGAGERIPKVHTGDGADTSPPLQWSGAPGETRQFALICDDPDAPTPQPWVHWVLYGIPADVTSLPGGVADARRPDQPAGAVQGKNSFTSGATVGYRGPAPPPGHGTHHYHFQILALDTELDLSPGLTKEQLLEAVEGHVLARGELVGTYER